MIVLVLVINTHKNDVLIPQQCCNSACPSIILDGMTNKFVARALKETASLIELAGGNPFRSRALANAARTIERLEKPVESLIDEGTLTDIKGIGTGLQEQISELLQRGSFALRDDLLGALPPGLLDMLSIKGLGAKKVRELWKKLSIQTLDELEFAAGSGRIAELTGFGEKSQRSILVNIAALRSYRSRRHFADVWVRTETLIDKIRGLPEVCRVEPAGELRRQFETVGQVEILIGTNNAQVPANLEDITGKLEIKEQTEPRAGDVLCLRGSISDGLPLELSVCSDAQFGSVWFLQSASREFISEWQKVNGPVPDVSEESEIFDRAGSAFIEPEIRDSPAIITEAGIGPLPGLITGKDLKGTLHNHSTYSDGAHSLREMARTAHEMGLSYFGICDHSQSLKIAYGLSLEEVARQQEEIRDLNKEFESDDGVEFKIFSGIESDILEDGSLDYPDHILESFDFIVASVHTGFNMTEEKATERVIRAVSNPYTSILGHPTGRLLLRREGYPLNHGAVIDACARYGVAIELNANPYRLDLDWRWIEAARKRGVLISINPDAHATEQLAYHRWGIAVARKGRLTAEGCLNAMDLTAFTEWISRRN